MRVSIIGSGVSGICAAIRLRSKGFDVAVYEKNKMPGGKLNTFKLDGFRFDAGPSLFTMPQLVDELFELNNLNPRDYFKYKKKKIHCKYFWDDKTKFTAYSNRKKFLKEVKNKFKVEESTVNNYLKKAKIKYDLTEKIFLRKSLHKLSSFLNIETIKALFNLNIFQINKTLNEVNSDELKNKYLIQIFNRYATYNGSSPYKTPGMMTLIQHLENHFGTFVPEGGMYEITNTLFNLAKQIGVKFYFECNVDEIILEKKAAKKIKVNNNLIESDIIISNVDINFTYKNLLKQKFNHRSLKNESSSSALIFYWGIKGTYDKLDLHNIFFSSNYKEEFDSIFEKKQVFDDPTVYINISCKDVSSDAPKGSENWFVMINSPYNINQNWDRQIQISRKKIINKLEKILGIEIGKNIIKEKVYSPIDLESKTNSFNGSLYGSSSNNIMSSFMRHPNFTKRIKNLFFCGGSVHPGGGIPLAILSSKIVSDLIESK
jgi:phytoene desaturase